MAMSQADRDFIDGKFNDVHERLNPVCEQVAKNTTDIGWLKWNQRKAVGLAAGGVVAGGVAILLFVVGVS